MSIPVPLAGPRLELIEGGAAKKASVAPEPKRTWLPAVLAAAAIGLGVLGVGTLMTSGGAAPDARMSAPAAATVAPTAAATTPAAPVTAPTEMSASEGMAQQQLAEPMPAPPPAAVAATPTFEPAMADDGMTEAPATGATTSTGGALRMGSTGAGGGGAAGGASVQAPAARARGGAPGRSDTARGAIAGGDGSDTAFGQGASPAAEGPTTQAERVQAEREVEPARPLTPAREAPTPPVTVAPEPRTTAGPAVETLDRETVQSVMQSVEPAVRACAGERHGTAQVDVVVQGTGRVTSATISGNFQGSPEGSCIARAVRGARFPQFTGEALRFRYPYGI